MAPWLIVVLVLAGICVALPLLAVCVIVILALLGPSIGNVFSDIIIAI
ncbi:MAG: pilus assembly protein [Chloroflexi bacterium]|nr:pilus assembly protein [Chloroflexota bacterium]